MAEIVSAVHGLRGSLYSSIAFARRLVARGHRVTFVGFRDVSADVRAAGFDWVQLTHGPESVDQLELHRAEVGTLRSIPTARRLRREFIASTEAGDALDRLDPDLLIVDAELHGVILPGIARAMSMLLVVPWPSPLRAPGLPALHTARQLPASRRERIAVAADWERMFLRRGFANSLGQLSPRALRRRMLPFQLNSPSMSNVRALAKTHGVNLRSVSSVREWIAPVTYSLPLLSMTAAEFDYEHDVPEQLCYSGPLIDEQRVEPLVTVEDRARWEAFRTAMAAEGRRIVYASMGSLQPGNATFYRRIIEEVRGRDDLAAVMGLGQRAAVADLGRLPDNVLALAYAPQLDVLASSWVAIHHGGIGTINECVHFEVPGVAASSGFVDEPGTVARFSHHRLGLEVATSDLLGPSLGSLIDRAGSDPKIRQGLRTMRASFDAAVADERGERLVDELIERGPSSRPGV